MPSPSSSLDPSLTGHWHSESQFTPPNTAIDSTHAQCHAPSLRLDEAAISRSEHTWNVEPPMRRSHPHNQSTSFSELEADLHQQAMAYEGMSQMHNRAECPSPQQADTTLAGEPVQSKSPAINDLFNNASDNEMPDFEESVQDDNMFKISGLGQPPHISGKQELEASFHTIRGICQTPCHASLADPRDCADPISHPSPTESQLVAKGFEFHNELSEDVQINRFNDKAFRKALREVRSDLPRKQQWYAWSKAKQMLDGEPASAVTEQMERSWGAPLERQDLHQYEREQEDGIWGSPAQSASLDAVIHPRSDERHAMGRQWVAQVPGQGRPSSSAATVGFAVGNNLWHGSSDGQNHGDWTSRPQKIDQDRLRSHPLGKLISKVAEEHQARRECEDRSANEVVPMAPDLPPLDGNDLAAATVIANSFAEIQALQSELHKVDDKVLSKIEQAKDRIVARRGGSAHGFLSHSNDTIANEQDWAMPGTEKIDTITNPRSLPSVLSGPLPQLSYGGTPPPPSYPSIERSTFRLRTSTSMHDVDLLRPYNNNNTNIHRSPSPSPSHRQGRAHLPPPISPNQRSPSPWIEHPGINRPDTPRPSHRTPDSEIRASVELETPYSQRIRERESTPAYSDRSPSPSPSPVSHLGTPHTHANANVYEDDTEMTDAPTPYNAATAIPNHHLSHRSSPDPFSSPLLHDGNTVTASSYPLPLTSTSPLRPPPIPLEPTPFSSLRPSKTRRKSIGGQTSKSNTKHRSATTATAAVQGSNVSKSRKVTQVAQKVKREATKKTTDGGSGGSKVADAVKKIQEGIEAVVVGSPRRSGRIVAEKGRKK